MSLDFQQVRDQVKQLGHEAPQRKEQMDRLRDRAQALLQQYALETDALAEKVQSVVRNYDPSLRCAVPAGEALTSHYPAPDPPARGTVIAADGSQIFLDRHAAVEYFLINIGAIEMIYGSAAAPELNVETTLYYGETLQLLGDYPSEERISLQRDLSERQKLAQMAAVAQSPVVTLTDGPLELWGVRDAAAGGEAGNTDSRDAYLQALLELAKLDATTAGYVDKPSEDYVVRLLEIASQPVQEAKNRPLRGVRDADLFRRILAPGERSPVFEIQSRSARIYKRVDPGLALHFFYLNVGRAGKPWLARVDTLGWVVHDSAKLDLLHAVLLHQCQWMGSRPYPYLLHRAHETALVTRDEKQQLEHMIANELSRHGIIGEESHKQGLKSLPGKGRYTR